MNDLTLTTVFGGRLRLKTGVDAFEARYGALVELLDDDGTIRDFDGLERVDAAVLGLALCDLARAGLSSQGRQEVMAEALERLAQPAGYNVFPFPFHASSGAEPPKTISDEDPVGGDVATPPVGIVEQLTAENDLYHVRCYDGDEISLTTSWMSYREAFGEFESYEGFSKIELVRGSDNEVICAALDGGADLL